MRLPALFFVVALAFLSDLAFRPLWNLGTATPDPPLLLVLWLALYDRRPRIHLVILTIAIVRAQFGLMPLLAAWSPLALAAESMFFARRFFDLRPPYFRYPVIALVVALHLVLTEFLIRHSLDATRASHVLLGVGASTLAAALLFPILHSVRPLLRSPEYPLFEGAKR